MNFVSRGLDRAAVEAWRTAFLVLIGGMLAVAIGLAIGNPTPEAIVLLVACAAALVQFGFAFRPFAAFICLTGNLFFFAVWAITPERYLNPFDMLLPMLLAVSVLGPARQEALAEDAALTGPAHHAIAGITARFRRAGLIYFGWALLSLGTMAIVIGPDQAFETSMFMVRALYGVMVFPLALWWLRTERQIHHTILAILIAGAGLAVVNVEHFVLGDTFRAGITWVVNHPDWPIEGSNEFGATLTLFTAFIVARNLIRPTAWTVPMLALVLALLILSQSRSGLISLVCFIALAIRSFRLRQLLALVILAGVVTLVLAPTGFIDKIHDTLTLRRGSWDVYTIQIRIYGFASAWRVFVDHWLIGVGYCGCRFLSHHYNDLRISMLGAENFFLETAAGLGVVGLAALGLLYVRLFQLGRIVLAVAPPGTMAHALARLHFPLVMGLTAANLTGDNFVGIVGIGQVALWCALLIRTGHLAVEGAAKPRE